MMASRRHNGEASSDRDSRSSHASDIDTFPRDLTTSDAPDGAGVHPEKNAEALGLITRVPSQGHADGVQAVTDETKPDEAPSRCARCMSGCLVRCRPCMTEHNPLPPSPSRSQRCRYACMCPPHGHLARVAALVVTVFLFWATLWGITGDNALPGGNFFALVVLVILCYVGGALVRLIRLPGLLGMLIVGCALRNIPVVNIGKDIDPAWSGALRNVALVVILTRAGLGLDPVALRKLSFGVIRLAFVPCLCETVAEAVAAHLILGFPWIWGFMLGFVLAAVSPAVVVPSMLSLDVRGYGVDKGIPTLVIAAASVDDVLAISGFGVVLGIAFSTGGLALTIVKGPLEAVLGVVYGLVFGVIMWYIPHEKHTSRAVFRFVMLFCGGLLAVFGSREADLSGAGPLGVLTIAFVAALRWRTECAPGENMPVAKTFGTLWILFEPILFGLIGAEVDLSIIQPQTIGYGIAVLSCGLAIRLVASFVAVFRLNFTWKEMFFIPFAWLPKATVQAAIGSVALDTARAKLDPDALVPDENVRLGQQLLTIAVLAIVITAPLGAIAIAVTGPRFLRKSVKTGTQENGLNLPENQSDAESHQA